MNTSKHAFLIGCYKNPDYLEEFIDSLDGPRSKFYIHVNKENTAEFENLRQRLKNRTNIIFVPSIKVIWGGMTLLLSLRIMLNEALKDDENNFFHFLTGQDALVRSLDDLYVFFDEKSNSNFVSVKKGYDPIKDPNTKELDCIQYHHTFDWFDNRNSFLYRVIEKLFVILQKVFSVKRKLPHKCIYKGAGWFSINRRAAVVLMQSMNDEREISKWKNCFATEEFFIPTILYNSSDELNLVNDSLRYVDWIKGPGPYPSVLDESFYNDIINSKNFFCRKVEPGRSDLLLRLLASNRDHK